MEHDSILKGFHALFPSVPENAEVKEECFR